MWTVSLTEPGRRDIVGWGLGNREGRGRDLEDLSCGSGQRRGRVLTDLGSLVSLCCAGGEVGRPQALGISAPLVWGR